MMINSFMHLGLHIVILIVSISLLVVSALAYRRNRRWRFCFVCVAFFVFAVKETILGVNVVFFQSPALEIVSHAIDLVILGCFFVGMMDMGR